MGTWDDTVIRRPTPTPAPAPASTTAAPAPTAPAPTPQIVGGQSSILDPQAVAVCCCWNPYVYNFMWHLTGKRKTKHSLPAIATVQCAARTSICIVLFIFSFHYISTCWSPKRRFFCRCPLNRMCWSQGPTWPHTMQRQTAGCHSDARFLFCRWHTLKIQNTYIHTYLHTKNVHIGSYWHVLPNCMGPTLPRD